MATLRIVLLVALLVISGCDSSEPRSEPGEPPVRILSLNIWHDASDWPQRSGVIIDTLRSIQPDVVCLQEVVQRSNLPNQAYSLADSLGYDVYFTSVDTAGSPVRFGNAILTRNQIQDSTWMPLDPPGDSRNAAYVRTRAGDFELDVFCTHLHHTASDSGATIRRTQMQHLSEFIDSTLSTGRAVVAGDFNAEPGSEEFGPLLATFEDSFDAAYGEGPRPSTLNPYIGHPERWIDYIFIQRDAGISVWKVRRILATREDDHLWASDHFGVLAELYFDR